jgi:uncharacterized protein related to proFAR isomerase
MALHLDTLLEGSPAYGVLDAKDGVVLYRRAGKERVFEEVVAAVIENADDRVTVIPLANERNECDRLFIAPLEEERSFDS